MSGKPSRDWPKIRARLRRDQWYVLGKNMPYTTYTAIKQGSIAALREGVEARTRNNHRVDGKRRCDILLKLED